MLLMIEKFEEYKMQGVVNYLKQKQTNKLRGP
jgi:hypothetical protein